MKILTTFKNNILTTENYDQNLRRTADNNLRTLKLNTTSYNTEQLSN